MKNPMRRKDDLPRKEVDEFQDNPCSWEQAELNRRKKEYLLKELKSIEKALKEMDEGEGSAIKETRDELFEQQMRNAMEAPLLPKVEINVAHSDQFESKTIHDSGLLNKIIPPSPMPTISVNKKVDITIPVEMSDWVQVLEQAAQSGQHKSDNWLEKDGNKCSKKDMYASICRHTAEWYAGGRLDHKSGLHPLLHAAARCLMMYTRWCKGLIHKDDEE